MRLLWDIGRHSVGDTRQFKYLTHSQQSAARHTEPSQRCAHFPRLTQVKAVENGRRQSIAVLEGGSQVFEHTSVMQKREYTGQDTYCLDDD